MKEITYFGWGGTGTPVSLVGTLFRSKKTKKSEGYCRNYREN
jgi:hypothetical protein